MGAAGIESAKNVELPGVSGQIDQTEDAETMPDTGAKSADCDVGAKPPCEKIKAGEGAQTAIETAEVFASSESGVALVEERDRQIKTLAIAVDSMLVAGLFQEARVLSARLRELVERQIFSDDAAGGEANLLR